MSGLRALRRRRRRRLRLVSVLFIAAVIAWFIGLFWFADTLPDRGSAPPGDTDAIIVVTGGSERLAEGLSLLAAGRGRKLFVSGVYRGVDVTALLRVARQAPAEVECCIVLGYTADNTAGNADETAAWMTAEGFTSLRLVTASYHMPRSLLEFRRTMPDVTILPHPVFPPQFKQNGWWLWPGSANLIINEFNK